MKGNQLIGLIDVMASGKTGVLALLAALLVLVSSGVNQTLLVQSDADVSERYLPLFETQDPDLRSTVSEWRVGEGLNQRYFFEVTGTLSDNFYCENNKLLQTRRNDAVITLFCESRLNP